MLKILTRLSTRKPAAAQELASKNSPKNRISCRKFQAPENATD
jgi:hypothetical protein